MKKVLLPIVLFAAALGLQAAERSEAEMRAIAAAKLSSQALVKGQQGSAALKPMSLERLVDEKTYSIFTPADGDGFVIVAKSDLVEPVIGYSTGSIDPSDMPEGLCWFLGEWNRQVTAAETAGNSALAPRRAAATFTPVENFVTTTWSQEYPFDRKTPNNYPSGCVATALAQCLNYCQWPASAEFEGDYYVSTTKGKKTTTERKTETVSTTYTWPYKDSYKTIGRYGDNIDELLRDCGYACYMQYSASGSGTYTYLAGIALTHVFGYPQESVTYYDYDKVSDADTWAQLIYDELALRSPVLYGGADNDFGGHAFVFSGIDEQGYVYVNWGWRGQGDGFYAITSLNPPANEESRYNFTHGAEMITGIRVNPQPTDHVKGFITAYAGDPFTFRFGTEKDDNDVERLTLYCDLPYGFINMNASDFQGVFGIFGQDLTDGTDWVIALDLQDRDTIPSGYGYTGTSEQYKDFYFYYFVDGEQGLKPGHKYRLSFGVRDDREGTWHSIICNGGELGYDIDFTGAPETSTISAEKTPVPVLTSIRGLTPTASSSSHTDGLTRVFDSTGRLIYLAPTARFNLWDIPAHGILFVKEGDSVRKVVR